jgi:hypothetical protein
MDEKRKTFPASLWHKTGASTELEQCWFPGTHSNIGGPAGDALPFEEIADITLAWMVDNLSGKLTFESDAIKEIVKEHRVGKASCSAHSSWGCSPISDNFDGIQGMLWRLLGEEGRTIGRSDNESVHPIARLRWNKLGEKPTPLKQYDGSKSTWSTTGSTVEEYKMKDNKLSVVEYKKETSESGAVNEVANYGEAPSLSKQLCPELVWKEIVKAQGSSSSNNAPRL